MRSVGVIGAVVWNRVRLFGSDVVLEGWGGALYSAAALRAHLDLAWSVCPITTVGADLAEDLHQLMDHMGLSHGRVEVRGNVTPIVELRYRRDGTRQVDKAGMVPPCWSADDVAKRVGGLSGLLVNFVDGRELALSAAQALRELVSGPVYADLHGLQTAPDTTGDWLDCFDCLQAGERDLARLGDPGAWNRRWLGLENPGHLGVMTMTMGSRGALVAEPMAPAYTYIPPNALAPGDPTGCGDVFAGAMFSRQLQGSVPAGAAARATVAAYRNVGHEGVDRGLVDLLRR